VPKIGPNGLFEHFWTVFMPLKAQKGSKCTLLVHFVQHFLSLQSKNEYHPLPFNLGLELQNNWSDCGNSNSSGISASRRWSHSFSGTFFHTFSRIFGRIFREFWVDLIFLIFLGLGLSLSVDETWGLEIVDFI
jgi:hypothetical protein